jgi:hypothetical protein
VVGFGGICGVLLGDVARVRFAEVEEASPLAYCEGGTMGDLLELLLLALEVDNLLDLLQLQQLQDQRDIAGVDK